MNISQLNRDVISAFINKFIDINKIKSSLVLSHTDFHIFSEISVAQKSEFTYRNQPFPQTGKWQLVLGDFPLGARAIGPLAESGLKSYISAAIDKSLSYILPNGYGIFTVEPLLILSEKDNIRKILSAQGFSILAVLNSTKDFLKPYTALSPHFIVVKKELQKQEFVAEFETTEQSESLAKNMLLRSLGANLSQGIWVEPGCFPGFSKWKVRLQINSLDTEYKKFTPKKLSDIAVSINACKQNESFSDIENTIYIPKIGTLNVISDLIKTTKKHQNYFQVECDPQQVNPGYLVAFFNSKLGQLSLESLTSQSYIPNINKSDLLELDISLPTIDAQTEIVSSIKKLSLIKDKITSFEENLAVNPISSDYALKQIDLMLDVVGELADADKVKSMIRSGESKNVEFKETLSLDIKKQTKEKYIEDSAIKTVAAFLNTSGGTLLVGIADSGQINGIDKEIEMFHKAAKDKFLLHFKNLIRDRVGEQFYPFIDHKIVMVDSKEILCVDCVQSETEVYLDGKDFFVRTNPATDKLEGPKLVAYINHHFKH